MENFEKPIEIEMLEEASEVLLRTSNKFTKEVFDSIRENMLRFQRGMVF